MKRSGVYLGAGLLCQDRGVSTEGPFSCGPDPQTPLIKGYKLPVVDPARLRRPRHKADAATWECVPCHRAHLTRAPCGRTIVQHTRASSDLSPQACSLGVCRRPPLDTHRWCFQGLWKIPLFFPHKFTINVIMVIIQYKFVMTYRHYIIYIHNIFVHINLYIIIYNILFIKYIFIYVYIYMNTLKYISAIKYKYKIYYF